MSVATRQHQDSGVYLKGITPVTGRERSFKLLPPGFWTLALWVSWVLCPATAEDMPIIYLVKMSECRILGPGNLLAALHMFS
jgi:hypothetical protein